MVVGDNSQQDICASVIGDGSATDVYLIMALRGHGASVRFIASSPEAAARVNAYVRLESADCIVVDPTESTEISRHISPGSAIFCTYAASDVLNSLSGEALWQKTVVCTRAAVEAALSAGASRMVYLSSILCLGHTTDSRPVDTDAPYQTDDSRTALERALFRAEMEAWQGGEKGLRVTSVCAGWILAPADLCTLTRDILADPNRRGNTGVTTAFLDARDLAEALIASASESFTGKRRVCAGHNKTFADAARAIAPEGAKQKKNVISRIFGLKSKNPLSRFTREDKSYASDPAFSFRPFEETAEFCRE